MCRWMTALSGVVFLWVSSLAAAQQTPSGIPLDAPWKMVVYEFATSKLEHSAWGFQHSERDYQLALLLAESEGLLIDRDVLFAAAFLHDLGAFEPFAVAGAEHSRSLQDSRLDSGANGFPDGENRFGADCDSGAHVLRGGARRRDGQGTA